MGAGRTGTDRLTRRYGSEAGDVAASGPLTPVADGVPVLLAELHWGMTAEGALTVEDLLERRTRLSLVDTWAAAAREAAVSVVEGRNAQA